MAEGGGQLVHLNVVFHGPPGAGKTSLKRVVLGEPPLDVKEQNSTRVIDNAVRAVSIDRAKEFKMVSNDDLLNMLADALKNCIENPPKESSADPTGTRPSDGDGITTTPQQSYENVPTTSTPIHEDIEHSKSVPKPRKSSNRRSLLRMIKTTMKSAKPSSAMFDTKWHHFLDSGGQPQFQDIQPLLYNSPSLQIVVVRLTEGLNEKPKMCYLRNGESICLDDRHLQLTNRQYIERMCQIAAASGQTSCVMIVGTRKDVLQKQLGINEAAIKIDEFNRKLKSIHGKYRDVLICKSQCKTIFDINTMATGEERKENTKELQEVISDVLETISKPHPVPLKWLAFHLGIDATSEDVVSLSECFEVGEDVGIAEESEVKEALVYLNRAALLLYYPDSVPDLVLTKVDPLVDRLSRLVEASFTYPLPSFQEESDKLRRKGLFTKTFLDKLFNDYSSNVLNNEKFLELLECLKIIVSVGEDEYFLPSALSCDSPASLDQNFRKCCTPVGFSWGERTLPHGFFSTLIVELMSKSGTNYEFTLSKSTNHCRDEIQICERKSRIPGAIKLTNRIKWIQVSTSSSSSKHCPTIRKAVEAAIERTADRLKHTGVSPSPRLCPECPCHVTDSHYCSLTPNKEEYTCSVDESVTGPTTSEMLCWMEGINCDFCCFIHNNKKKTPRLIFLHIRTY